jgi:outer membrane protein TolC
MRRNTQALAVPALLLSLTLAGTPHAQTAPAPDAVASSKADVSDVPEMPQVADPMLEPVAPPAHVLSSWRDAITMVRARSTVLHSAEAQVEQAEGLQTSALAGALPKLSATGNIYRLMTPPPSNAAFKPPEINITASLDLRQPLFNLPAWNGISAAKARTRAAALTSADTQRQLLGSVAGAAITVITANRIAESSRVSLSSALSTLDLTKRRAALGAASAVDVLRAEQEVSTSRAQVVSADEQLRQAREALGNTLGDPVQWDVSDAIRLEDLERDAMKVCHPVDSLDTRTDIRSAQKSVDAAQKDRTSVDYSFAPSIDLTSSLGYFNYTFRSPSFEHFAWTLGAVATWALFDGGDRYGQMRQRDAAETIAKETLTQTRRNASLQVTQADRAVLVAVQNLEVSTKTRDLAKESARLARIAFINGSGTSFDLVDQARRLREAEIDLVIKNFNVFQARIAAFLAKANCSI